MISGSGWKRRNDTCIALRTTGLVRADPEQKWSISGKVGLGSRSRRTGTPAPRKWEMRAEFFCFLTGTFEQTMAWIQGLNCGKHTYRAWDKSMPEKGEKLTSIKSYLRGCLGTRTRAPDSESSGGAGSSSVSSKL